MPSVCVLGLFCGVANARAATLYAYANGTGTPAGCPTESTSSSGCSLATALSAAAAADTVMLATAGATAGGSNYVGNWSIGTSGTSSGAPVTIDGSDVADATLDGNKGSATGCTTTSCDGPVLTVSNDMFLVIKDLKIQNGYNSANSVGGGIQNDNGGTVTITGSTFAGNATGDGGAVDNGDNGGSGTVTITGSTFAGNTAAFDGGAVDNGDEGSGTVTITGSTFTGNTAGYGGAVDNGDFGGSGTATITDSTFSGDSARDGGGEIDASDGTLVLAGSTLAAAAAGPDVTGGSNGGSGSVFVSGDVFASGCQQDGGTWTDAGYNAGAGTSCFKSGPGDVNAGSAAALNLGSLAPGGGSTETLALGSGSKAIGIVPSPTQVTLNSQQVELCNGSGSDQRGDPRPGTGKAACDAGAFETQLPTLYAYASGASTSSGCPQTSTAGEQCSLGRALSLAAAGDTVELATPGATAGGANYVGNWSIGAIGTSSGAPVTIDGSGVSDASLDGNDGGAMGCTTTACDGPVLTVANSMFLVIKDVMIQHADNTSNSFGGGLQNDAGGTVRVSDSTFTDNTAGGDGGAIDNGDDSGSGTVTVSDSTLAGNAAADGDGGAIDDGDHGGSGTVTISDSTFSSNFALHGGPDLTANRNGGSGQVFVAGDVFASDCQQSGGTWFDGGYNVGFGMSCFNGGTGDVNAASLGALDLRSLANNGGPTETIALGGGSPAAEIIPNTTMVTLNGSQVALCPGSDQRGVPRPEAGVRDCDAGAYETQPVAPLVRITAPGDGDSYAQGSKIMADYSCAEGNDGPGLVTGSAGCQGTVTNGASIDTGTAGPHAFRVTAASRDALTTTITVHYTVIGPPVNLLLPKISGTARPGDTLSCSHGSWSNGPIGFSYQWSRDGTPIVGAMKSRYTVQTSDEGLTLTCTVTASDIAGAGKPVTSAGVRVPVPVVARCPAATGSVSGSTLGLIRLGMTRKQVTHEYTHSTTRGFEYKDFFCLTPFGVRVGFASPTLLDGLPKRERGRYAGRVVWASTDNARYAVNGIRAGATLAAAEQALKQGYLFRVGLNYWYLAPISGATAVLKVRHDEVQEIGIADKQLTGSHKADRHLMTSFD